jgi:XisI protein
MGTRTIRQAKPGYDPYGDSIMDKLNHYRESISKFLSKYVDVWQEEGVETQLIIDSERDHYLLLRVGWEKEQRINYAVFQFDIKDEKIWIQENNTDVEVDKELEEMGISKKEMVVGFHHPSMREYSDYAVA